MSSQVDNMCLFEGFAHPLNLKVFETFTFGSFLFQQTLRAWTIKFQQHFELKNYEDLFRYF